MIVSHLEEGLPQRTLPSSEIMRKESIKGSPGSRGKKSLSLVMNKGKMNLEWKKMCNPKMLKNCPSSLK